MLKKISLFPPRSTMTTPTPTPRQTTTSQTTIHGWNFFSRDGPIDGIPRLVSLSRRLADPYSPDEQQNRPFCVHGATRSLKPCLCGSALVMGINMHMPEAVFGQNCLLITHQKTGRTLSFHVEDALRIWAKQSVEDGSRIIYSAHRHNYVPGKKEWCKQN